MKWSTQKINELHKYLVDSSTLNVSSIIRDLKILNDSEAVEFPYHTEGEFIKVPFLKKGYIEFDYTSEEIRSLLDIKSDASILSKFIKINDHNGVSVDFNLYNKQKEFVQNYKNNKFNIVKHSRQVGMSHLMSLIVLHHITTKTDKKVVWICENFRGDFDRFIRFLSYLPYYISPGIVDIKDNANVKKVTFDNGCNITFTKSITSSVGDFIVIDNAIIELSKTLTLLLPKIASSVSTQCFIVSSSNKDSYFEKLFQLSNNWNKVIMNWDVVPDRDIKWVSETIHQIGGIKKFLDEYEVEGNTSKIRDLVIDLLAIDKFY